MSSRIESRSFLNAGPVLRVGSLGELAGLIGQVQLQPGHYGSLEMQRRRYRKDKSRMPKVQGGRVPEVQIPGNSLALYFLHTMFESEPGPQNSACNAFGALIDLG